MKMSKKMKLKLFALLIILNIILRLQVTSHEIGWDSFEVHTVANSLSTFGYAKWWIHPASIIGSYPYSITSAVPFLLSGFYQSINENMELIIFLYCMILGFFSIFTAYLIAGVIWNNDLFKFLVAFVFSTSQGIVTYTTWTTPTRTLFVVLLPLFIYLLLKTRTFNVRFGILTFITLVLLLATHHYVYFCAPIIMSYFGVIIFYKLGKYVKFIRIPENFVNIGLIASFFFMFLIPFFTRTFLAQEGASSRYGFIFEMLKSYSRYIGVLIVFVVGGYTYLLFKQGKRFEEWFLLLALVSLAIFLYIPTYMKWFMVFFASLLIGISLTNIAKTRTEKKKYAASFIIILLLLSVSFTGYYQFLHFLNDPSPYKRYIEERTYVGALWIKDNIDKSIIAGPLILTRIAALSEVPTLVGSVSDLVYGFVDSDKLEVKQAHSPLSVEFYFYDPYILVNHTHTSWSVGAIERSDINVYFSYAWRIVREFNLSYYVENEDTSTTFSRSVQQTKDNIYDNGKISIWVLD